MLDWIIYSWYCPNCKEEVAGLKDKKNQIKVKCSRCGAEMIRTIVGRRHDVIDIYAPDVIDIYAPAGEKHHDAEVQLAK